ncbi:Flp family type IVb pilin [Actinomadura kijaniata]|uniref:Flp family type IVb pilin n=1 Tax=Actinomadura kijaniata TaxID=46161 RepID=UPI003F1D2E5E
MNPIIPLYVTLQTFVQDRVEQVKERSDRGASAIEYGALLVVSAVVIGVLVSIANTEFKTAVTGKIKEVFSN